MGREAALTPPPYGSQTDPLRGEAAPNPHRPPPLEASLPTLPIAIQVVEQKLFVLCHMEKTYRVICHFCRTKNRSCYRSLA